MFYIMPSKHWSKSVSQFITNPVMDNREDKRIKTQDTIKVAGGGDVWVCLQRLKLISVQTAALTVIFTCCDWSVAADSAASTSVDRQGTEITSSWGEKKRDNRSQNELFTETPSISCQPGLCPFRQVLPLSSHPGYTPAAVISVKKDRAPNHRNLERARTSKIARIESIWRKKKKKLPKSLRSDLILWQLLTVDHYRFTSFNAVSWNPA